MKELLDKIKTKGYWKVIIRPTTYSKDFIDSLDKCEKLIQENKVVLRGWDYPHIEEGGIRRSSDDSIHSFCDWPEGPKYEYWRFYKTGQFIHYFAMREDLRLTPEKMKELQDEHGTKSTKYLSILSTLYSVTEIYEFASRMYSKIDNSNGIEIIIELHDVKGRVLTFWDYFARYLSLAYICEYENNIIVNKKIRSRSEMIIKASDFALDVTIEIFNAFNWKSINKEMFREDQKKLLERRL